MVYPEVVNYWIRDFTYWRIKLQLYICNTSGIAVSIVTRLQAGESRVWIMNSVRAGVKNWGIKLSTHPHVVRSRMEVIPLLPYMPSWHGEGPLYLHKESKPTSCTTLLFYYFYIHRSSMNCDVWTDNKDNFLTLCTNTIYTGI
jgi:hypothetical protein